MYSLEERLRAKYGKGFSAFPLDFVERVRGLDEIRRSLRRVEPYSYKIEKPVGQTGISRAYYLFDASALHHIYVPDDKLTERLDHFIEQKGLGRAFLFVPNFCVAEVFNSLARRHFRQNELTVAQYRLCREAFRLDIHNGLLFYHYELNRYHVLNTDYIMPFEHLFETCRPKGCKKGEQWSLSTLDLLIIGMGMELTRMTGGETYIVTCDRRIDKVARVLADLDRDHRSQHEIPNYIRFPRTLYLWETSLEDLPRVNGQRVG
jgi:hypothetical protein